MNIALWILQVLVGGFFLYHLTLMYRPPANPQGGMQYMRDMSPRLRIFAGTAEGLAGLALIFAGLVHPISGLVPLAGAGLVVLMLGAIVFHVRRREYPNLGLNAVLLVLAGFIAYGRWFLSPF